MDLFYDEKLLEFLYFVNFEIKWMFEDKGLYEEGCLLVLEFYEEVKCLFKVCIDFLDYNGV